MEITGLDVARAFVSAFGLFMIYCVCLVVYDEFLGKGKRK